MIKKNVMNSDSLFSYLDSQIEILYESLYSHLLQKALKKIWCSLVDVRLFIVLSIISNINFFLQMLSNFLNPHSCNTDELTSDCVILLRKYFEVCF